MWWRALRRRSRKSAPFVEEHRVVRPDEAVEPLAHVRVRLDATAPEQARDVVFRTLAFEHFDRGQAHRGVAVAE